jgi:hypothetical protein
MPGKLERSCRTFRPLYPMTELSDHLLGDFGDLRIVFHHEHSPTFGMINDAIAFGPLLLWRSLGARQIKRDAGAASEFAADRHRSPRLMGKTVDLRQTESAAFVRTFGGEEWIEHQGQDVRGNAAAVVGNAQRDEFTSQPRGCLFRRQLRVLGRDADDAAVLRHCIAGV